MEFQDDDLVQIEAPNKDEHESNHCYIDVQAKSNIANNEYNSK